MNTQELNEHKLKLMHDVLQLVKQFTVETGLYVNRIDIDVIETTTFDDPFPRLEYGLAKTSPYLP